MKLIGAGFMRTGTMSTQAALGILGFRCYHMREVARQPGHLAAWTDLVKDIAPMDWKALLADYDATVDMPACWYYKELMETFPDAKVLLNVREPERWQRSFATLWAFTGHVRRLRFIPKLRRFVDFGDALATRVFRDNFAADNCIRVFNEHNAAVQRIVPGQRLLVFRVTDGWEPLCAFLGCDVPQVPFPHLNEGDETLRASARRVFLGPWLMRIALLLGALGLAAAAIYALA